MAGIFNFLVSSLSSFNVDFVTPRNKENLTCRLLKKPCHRGTESKNTPNSLITSIGKKERKTGQTAAELVFSASLGVAATNFKTEDLLQRTDICRIARPDLIPALPGSLTQKYPSSSV
jgi:hypothetical protein